MTSYHPDLNILTEYSAGALQLPLAISVSTHLHFCAECRHSVQKMEQLGGTMIETLAPQPLPEQSFEKLMSAIEINASSCKSERKPDAQGNKPHVINQLLKRQAPKWRRVTSALQTATLNAGQQDCEVSLQKIKAGGKVPKHDHRGLEVTVVLEGSFSDEAGIYRQGDFLIKEPGDVHQPISARNQDCLCLSIQQAPVKLTGFFGTFINPFLKLQTA